MNKPKRAKSLPAKPKKMELFGLTEAGRLVLWSVDRVVPETSIRYRRGVDGRRLIDDGNFVIDWFGSEVVAHLGNLVGGKVSVQLMCNGGPTFALSRREVGRMLRYKVVKDPKVEAEILASLKRATAAIVAAQDTPDRQRRLHAKPWLFRPGETAPKGAAGAEIER